MIRKARRLAACLLRPAARRAVMALGLAVWAAGPAQAQRSEEISLGNWSAWFEAPTDRYGHNVLGGLPEWGRLCLIGPASRACVTLPQSSVFEDTAPRLEDVDGDGKPEAIVVESDASLGAQLSIYALRGDTLQKRATPHIGTRYRWLAPAGIGDLDGDGYIELAYIDRPHLAKTLRIWRYREGALQQVDSLPGLTNHRIGEDYITGGLRDCGQGPELILVDARWRQVVRTGLDAEGKILKPVPLTDYQGPVSVQRILNCLSP